MTCLVTLNLESLKVFEYVFNKEILYSQNFKSGIPLFKDFSNQAIQMAAMRPISEIWERYCIHHSY